MYFDFTVASAGVSAGSWTADIQSVIGNIPGGSLFSWDQSMGAIGVVTSGAFAVLHGVTIAYIYICIDEMIFVAYEGGL